MKPLTESGLHEAKRVAKQLCVEQPLSMEDKGYVSRIIERLVLEIETIRKEACCEKSLRIPHKGTSS